MNDFLANLQEDEPKFNLDEFPKEGEGATPPESQPEKVEAVVEVKPNAGEEKPSQGGDSIPDEDKLPFHKHPRWKEREDNHKKELSELETKIRKEFEEKLDTFNPKSPQDEQLPEWFKILAGDDEYARKSYALYKSSTAQEQARIKEEAKREILDEQRKQAEEEKRASQEANSIVDNQLKELEAEGKKFDKNKLLKIALDYQPTTSDGLIDLHKAYDIYELHEKAGAPKADAKKEVASRTSPTPTGDAKPITYKTSLDFQKRRAGEI